MQRARSESIDVPTETELSLGVVDAIAEKLDTKLREWRPEICQEVRALLLNVIEAADNDALDLIALVLSSRKCQTSRMSPRPGEAWHKKWIRVDFCEAPVLDLLHQTIRNEAIGVYNRAR